MERSYLERTRPVRLLPAQIKLTHDREPHEEPVAEAVVVNELEDVLHTQVDQRHETLQAQAHISSSQGLSRKALASPLISHKSTPLSSPQSPQLSFSVPTPFTTLVSTPRSFPIKSVAFFSPFFKLLPG